MSPLIPGPLRHTLRVTLPVVLLLLVSGCGESPSQGDDGMPQRTVAEVLADRAAGILDMPDVSVVYESALEDGTPCIKIGVSGNLEGVRQSVGDRLEGHPVVYAESGPIELKGG